MADVEAHIEQGVNGGYVLRVLVDAIRVEVTHHPTLDGAARVLRDRLERKSYGEVNRIVVGDLVFRDLAEAVRHLRALE